MRPSSRTGDAPRLVSLIFEASVIAEIILHFILNKLTLCQVGCLLVGLHCFYCNLPASL